MTRDESVALICSLVTTVAGVIGYFVGSVTSQRGWHDDGTLPELVTRVEGTGRIYP